MIGLKQAIYAASPVLYRRLQGMYGSLGDWLYDLYHGIDTHARPTDGIEEHTRDSVEYRPTQPQVLGPVFQMIDVAPDDVFLDFGAGKGRVVLQAAQLPFRRVIGVEISERLSVQARRNIKSKRRRLVCRSVEIVTADASSFAVPDDVTVVYMFNPFQGETFKTVIQNILRSFERRPRRLRLIYFLPAMHEYLIAHGFKVMGRSFGSLRLDGAPNVDGSHLVIYDLGTELSGRRGRIPHEASRV